MFRFVVGWMFTGLIVSAQAADAPEARARAALALATAASDSCGTCREDLDACRAEARRTGQPIVVFVGGCRARGQVARDAGAIPCRVASYDRDDPVDPFGPRVVVLSPRGQDLLITSLPPGATADQIRAAVLPPPILRSVRPVPGACPGGMCPAIR